MLQSQIALLRLIRYFEAVDDWNFALWLNRNKIRLLVGERQAELYFLAYSDDDRATEASLVITDLAHKASNQSMKPTGPFQSNLSVFTTTPCRGLSLSR
jgi:hypothetical protein